MCGRLRVCVRNPEFQLMVCKPVSVDGNQWAQPGTRFRFLAGWHEACTARDVPGRAFLGVPMGCGTGRTGSPGSLRSGGGRGIPTVLFFSLNIKKKYGPPGPPGPGPRRRDLSHIWYPVPTRSPRSPGTRHRLYLARVLHGKKRATQP